MNQNRETETLFGNEKKCAILNFFLNSRIVYK